MSVKLIHGDCLEVLAGMGDGSVDHVITDPPYSEHTHAKQWIGSALTAEAMPRCSTAHKGLGFDFVTQAEAEAFAGAVAKVVARWVGIFTDIEGLHMWRTEVLSCGLDYVRACVWDKVDSAPQFTGDRPAAGAEIFMVAHPKGRKRWNGGGRRNVFRFAVNGQRGPKPHPTTKPLPLMLELVRLFTDPGDTILDPFMGSGTTGVACVELGRNFIGIEKDRKWFEVAQERIAGARFRPTLDFAARTKPPKQKVML
jgi:DNA modification methylase